MNKYDNIIVGAGLSGLLNAIFCAAAGKKVLLISKGTGALTIGSGVIDLLGYNSVGESLSDPFIGFDTLERSHPYKLMMKEDIKKAVDAFIHICEKYGYKYISDGKNHWVPTALGRLKPTFLIPHSMDIEQVRGKSEIIIASIEGLKDFNPLMMTESFSIMNYFKSSKFKPVTVQLVKSGGRDMSMLDAARRLDDEAELAKFIELLRPHTPKGAGVIIPAILGSKPSYKAYDYMRESLGVSVCESIVSPPGVTGYRLRTMLMDILKSFSVEMIENAEVVSAAVVKGKCSSIDTLSPAGRRSYQASKYTIATGGFYGGGLKATSDKVSEPIFGLETDINDNWASERFTDSQSYAKYGVSVDKNLNALDKSGKIVADNVYFSGKIVGGSDNAYEHSGNGVALALAYLAAKRV